MEENEASHKSGENDFVSSTESLHELQHLSRRRTVSGTCSERSGGSSVKELTYIKSIQEHQAMGQDSRLMYVSKNGCIPFAVTSVLPWHKSHPRPPNRWNDLYT